MKIKNFKKLIATLLSLAIALTPFSLITTAAAEARSANIPIVNAEITFSDDEGTANGIVWASSSVESVEAALTVYKLVGGDWIYVDESYIYTTDRSFTLSVDFDCESGVTYRAVLFVTVFSDTILECDSSELEKICP